MAHAGDVSARGLHLLEKCGANPTFYLLSRSYPYANGLANDRECAQPMHQCKVSMSGPVDLKCHSSARHKDTLPINRCCRKRIHNSANETNHGKLRNIIFFKLAAYKIIKFVNFIMDVTNTTNFFYTLVIFQKF